MYILNIFISALDIIQPNPFPGSPTIILCQIYSKIFPFAKIMNFFSTTCTPDTQTHINNPIIILTTIILGRDTRETFMRE